MGNKRTASDQVSGLSPRGRDALLRRLLREKERERVRAEARRDERVYRAILRIGFVPLAYLSRVLRMQEGAVFESALRLSARRKIDLIGNGPIGSKRGRTGPS